MSALLHIDELRFAWPGALAPVLDIEHCHLLAEEKLFLRGPSGSGKSTLLGLVGGVLKPQQGRVQLLGSDLAAMSQRQRDRFRADHIGFVFQQFNLLPYLDVRGNVLLPLRFSRRRRQRVHDGDAEVRRLLGELGMAGELLHAPVQKLSVGQQQRVAVARALIGGPELIVADEPTSALDADSRAAFMRLLFAECERHRTSLLFVSHDQSLAAGFDRQIDLPAINRAGGVAA